MTKLWVIVISAFLEPSTAGSATAAFAGFLGDCAFWTPVTDAYPGCFCENLLVSMTQNTLAPLPRQDFALDTGS